MRIWIDVASPPQVLFFSAVIPELQARGHQVLCTSHGFDHARALMKQHGIDGLVVGEKYQSGQDAVARKQSWNKRAQTLLEFISPRQIDLATSYGSSTQASVAGRLGLPLVTGTDYEYANLTTMQHATRVLIPDVVPAGKFVEAGVDPGAIQHYPGLKEQVYLSGFPIDTGLRARLGVSEQACLALFRPAAPFAHYLDDRGRGLPGEVLEAMLDRPGTRVLVLPRTRAQRKRFEAAYGHHERARVLGEVLCGPSLIAASDLLISAGGSMNREAAVLGVPAATCFEGEFGAIDRDLEKQGKLVRIQSISDLERLRFERRRSPGAPALTSAIRDRVVEGICSTPRAARRAPRAVECP